MILKELPIEFKTATPVLSAIRQEGYEAYFVGGSVRDILLNQPIHDVDIATSAFPEEIKQLFHRTIDIGIEHGTVLVLYKDESYEITTFRTESSYQDFRRPDKVEFVRSLSEDLKRRDFTMNAIALTYEGEVIDLFNGVQDIHLKVIRAVGNPYERFHEDALRMMRGLRFVSQLDFELEKMTYKAIQENCYLLEKISVERIAIEFMKLLMGKFHHKALELFVSTGCYAYCPGLKHEKNQLIEMSKLLPNQSIRNPIQAWVLLVDHLSIEKKKIPLFMKSWKTSNDLIKKVQKVYEGIQLRKKENWNIWDVYQLGEEAVLEVEELLPFYGIHEDKEAARKCIDSLPISNLQQLQVKGSHLLESFNKKPGKWLSETLSFLEKGVVTKKFPNEKNGLLEVAREFLKE